MKNAKGLAKDVKDEWNSKNDVRSDEQAQSLENTSCCL